MVAMLCRELGGPTFSFTVHGPEEFDKPEFLGLREKIRRAAFVVAVSSFGRGQLCRWARPEDWQKLAVVRCGVEEDLLRAPVTPVPKEPRLVCVARMSEQKGQLLLVEAATLLAAEGFDFKIVLVGDGPMRRQLEDAIERCGVGNRFVLTGSQSGARVREEIIGSRADGGARTAPACDRDRSRRQPRARRNWRERVAGSGRLRGSTGRRDTRRPSGPDDEARRDGPCRRRGSRAPA